jgi:NitT/TauT family transport system substrate-binding protein
MIRPAILISVLAASLFWPLSAFSAEKGIPEKQSLRFVGVPSATSIPIWLAAKKGYFHDEGIDVDLQINRAIGMIADNVIGGHADVVYGGVSTMLVAFSKKAPIVSIATVDYASEWDLLVRADSPVQSIADLKGKTVAVIAPNSTCVLSLRRELEARQLPPDYVKFLLLAASEHVAAFGARRIDATCTFDPYRSQLVRQFGARKIWSTSDRPVGSNVTGNLIVHKDFVVSYPKTVLALQRAIARANRYANANPEEVYSLLAEVLKQDLSEARDLQLPKYADPPSRNADIVEIAIALQNYGFVSGPIDVTSFDRSVDVTWR